MAEVCTLLSAIQVDLYYQTFAGLQFKTSWKILFISLIRYGSVSCTANIRTQTFTRFFSFYMILCLFLSYLSTEASDNLLYPEGGNTVTKKKKKRVRPHWESAPSSCFTTGRLTCDPARHLPVCLSILTCMFLEMEQEESMSHPHIHTVPSSTHTHTQVSRGDWMQKCLVLSQENTQIKLYYQSTFQRNQ